MENYPGNAKDLKRQPTQYNERTTEAPGKPEDQPKKVAKVIEGQVVRRNKSRTKRFLEMFGGGDARGVWGFIVNSVLVPAAKEAVNDAIREGADRIIFGESRSHLSRNRGGGGLGHYAYDRVSKHGRNALERRDDPRERRQLSRRARSHHDFKEIILESRHEAEEVLDMLFQLVSKYDVATVADLYDLIGEQPTYMDRQFGWSDLRGAGIERLRSNEYLLDLPQPEELD